ncbi:MAG: thrombospondin type 3 repeat-containing protein [Prevotellaceae bacterium]|jgi:outer membrane protein OmpA-like peptidoglycan-associated protein|nr:thrombospondin type 3 repeat-containing protein [Prevotellaceae bacterium]
MVIDYLLKLTGYIAIIVIVIATGEEGKAQVLPDEGSFGAAILLTSIDDDMETVDFCGQWNNRNSENKKKDNGAKPVLVVDSDGDGVPDNEDLCPYIPGSKKAKGCPDKDDDGVPDFMDDCPYVPGLPELKGCPDSDGDGIPDHKDECPFEMGLALNNGCPLEQKLTDRTANNNNNITVSSEVRVIGPRKDVFEGIEPVQFKTAVDNNYYIELAKNLEIESRMIANESGRQIQQQSQMVNNAPVASSGTFENKSALIDSDNDGIPDRDDVCPNEPGTKANFGCPEQAQSGYRIWKVSKCDIILSNDETRLLENVFNNLTFTYGRTILENSSYSLLAQFADLLNKKYSWTVVLHCYTNEGDNTFRNQQLSVNRGETIRTYLLSKGVNHSRIQVKGYGDTLKMPNVKANRIEVEITR